MNKLPCINCILLPICKQRYNPTVCEKYDNERFLIAYTGFSQLNRNCSLIGDYVRVTKNKMLTERTYELQRFMTNGN